MDNNNYISPNKITKQFDITSGTLRRWAEAGRIKYIRPNGGKRIYSIDDVERIFKGNVVENEKEKKNEKGEIKEEINNLTLNIKKIYEKLKNGNQENKNESIKDIKDELKDLSVLINDINATF